MPKFEITLTRIYSIAITHECATEEEAEEFVSNYSWNNEDASDIEEGESTIIEIEE
jgi:hypothetical protein